MPSERLIAAVAQGLHLSLDERDHLFRLAGHHPPARDATSEHISPGLLRIFDRLTDSLARSSPNSARRCGRPRLPSR